MIISQNRGKVKKIGLSLINKVKSELSLPVIKFILEMCMGMVLTGSTNVNLIAGMLKEKIEVRHTLKRLHRMLLNPRILEIGNRLSLKESVSKIDRTTILALDGGDLSHQYGEKFEKSCTVKDGSSGELRKGYWLNQISGYNPGSKETYPILLSIYSTLEAGFKSATNETFKLVDKLVEKIGGIGLWVIDRGYDGGEILKYFLGKGLEFMLRMRLNNGRNIIYKGKVMNISAVVPLINRRIKYGNNGRFGSIKGRIEINREEYRITVVSYKDKRNKEPMVFMTNGWIKSTKELKRRIRGYFRRWGVEECYRFEKQGFNIEDSRSRNYDRIKTLLGLTIISWLILIKVNEEPRLKEVVLKEARMEKDKAKDRPKFIYYRLIRGIRNIFSGVRRLFLFRLKRQEREKVRKDMVIQMPLFKNLPFYAMDNMLEYIWLEEAA